MKPGGRGDVANTHILWQFQNGPDVPTPVTDGKYMYVVNDRGIMWCLDAKTGAPDKAFGGDGVIDLQEGLGLPLVPLAVDDNQSFEISDTRPARKAKPNPRSPRARPWVKWPSSQVPGLSAKLTPTDPTAVRGPLRFHRPPPRTSSRSCRRSGCW